MSAVGTRSWGAPGSQGKEAVRRLMQAGRGTERVGGGGQPGVARPAGGHDVSEVAEDEVGEEAFELEDAGGTPGEAAGEDEGPADEEVVEGDVGEHGGGGGEDGYEGSLGDGGAEE